MIRADTGVVAVDSDVTDIVTARFFDCRRQSGTCHYRQNKYRHRHHQSNSVDQFVASARNVRYVLYRVIDATTDTAVATTKGGDLELPFTGTITEIGGFVDTAERQER